MLASAAFLGTRSTPRIEHKVLNLRELLRHLRVVPCKSVINVSYTQYTGGPHASSHGRRHAHGILL